MVEAEGGEVSEVFMGIDLGTCNSAVGIWNADEGKYEILENEFYKQTTPSVVNFGKDG